MESEIKDTMDAVRELAQVLYSFFFFFSNHSVDLKLNNCMLCGCFWQADIDHSGAIDCGEFHLNKLERGEFSICFLIL
jgi:hypothetical protein